MEAMSVSSLFVKGERIATLDELAEQEYVIWCYGLQKTKVFHKWWFLHWQFAYAVGQVRGGHLFKCQKQVLEKGGNTDEMPNNKSKE